MEEIINEIRKEAKAQGQPVLRDESFDILSLLTDIKKPLKILEIGVNVGCSSVMMLLRSENAVLHGIEIDEELIKKAKENCKKAGVIDRVKIFSGDAGEILPMLSGKYDLIFLDGPKGHYYEYLADIKGLLNKGGVLFADNVLFMGLTLSDKEPPKKHRTIVRSLREFLKDLKEDENFESVLLDIEDGISVSVKVK